MTYHQSQKPQRLGLGVRNTFFKYSMQTQILTIQLIEGQIKSVG